MYAVLETGGKQYRVAAGDTLEIELLPATAGQVHTFDRVLLINKEGNVTVGNPVIAGATVKAATRWWPSRCAAARVITRRSATVRN
jgi:large subunit ribosomal protein L21